MLLFRSRKGEILFNGFNCWNHELCNAGPLTVNQLPRARRGVQCWTAYNAKPTQPATLVRPVRTRLGHEVGRCCTLSSLVVGQDRWRRPRPPSVAAAPPRPHVRHRYRQTRSRHEAQRAGPMRSLLVDLRRMSRAWWPRAFLDQSFWTPDPAVRRRPSFCQFPPLTLPGSRPRRPLALLLYAGPVFSIDSTALAAAAAPLVRVSVWRAPLIAAHAAATATVAPRPTAGVLAP